MFKLSWFWRRSRRASQDCPTSGYVADSRAPTADVLSPYALEISNWESVQGLYPLRMDKPTYIGRSPDWSDDRMEYIHIPGTMYRCHCTFDWNAEEERIEMRAGANAPTSVNGAEIPRSIFGPPKRPFNEGDVIVVMKEYGGPPSVRVRLVRVAEVGLI